MWAFISHVCALLCRVWCVGSTLACEEPFVSQHRASLGLAWPARQSDFKMMPNKSVSSIWGYYQLNYRSQHATEQMSWAVFGFTFLWTVDGLSVKSGCPRNILGGLSLFITFFEDWQVQQLLPFKKNISQTIPVFAERVTFSVLLLYYVKCLKVKLPAKLFPVSGYMDFSTLFLIEQRWWVLIGKTFLIYLVHENSPSERTKSSSVLLCKNHEDRDLQCQGIPHIGCYFS